MNKKTKKAIYSLCAAAGFLSSLFVPCYSSGGQQYSAAELMGIVQQTKKLPSASDFSDVDNTAWYYPYVDHLVKNGVIKGITESTYAPDGTFTIAECATVITRYLGLDSYAAKQRNNMLSLGIVGAEQWFSGYIRTLIDTNVFIPEEFGLSSDLKSVLSNADVFNRPIKRYEFANLITRSFDISTSTVTAHNLYPEVCGNGNSFITGAKYDSTVSLYSTEIADFDAIPEAYRENVLKAYYNGIFNGDAVGNFNPESNLSRSEMSKVIAVITNRSLRRRTEYRAVPEICSITEDKYITDGWGDKTLDRNYAYQLLCEASWNMTCSFDGASTDIAYAHGIFPENYGVEVRVYSNSGGVYNLCAESLINGTGIACKGSDMRVLFTLRNLENAKVEGALRVDIKPDGTVSYNNLYKPFSE